MCSRPPFRLELPSKSASERHPRIMFTKTEYAPGIKITDWEKRLEGKPIDNDPYCPGSLNYFLAHYKRIGYMADEPMESTMHAALKKIHLKGDMDKMNQNLNKSMVNYYTYKDTLACEIDLIDKICPQLCSESYQTTMQKSYSPPYPYAMQRFSFPTIPFLQNRKYRWTQDPALATTTFYDEGFSAQVAQIQKIKGFRTKSYDPIAARNSDGTLPPERKQRCFDPGF